MKVNDVRDRILELSHDEVAPDTGLQEKALNWLNAAYREMLDEIQPFLQADLLQEQSVTTAADGIATLASPVQRVIKVVDSTNSRTLKQIAYGDLLEIDPQLSSVGNPIVYWLAGSKITVHPKAEVGLNMVYLPEIADLVVDGLEADILIPPAWHSVLVWGGLVWASIYERAFSASADLVLFQRKWEEGKQRVKLSLASNPDKVLRIEPSN